MNVRSASLPIFSFWPAAASLWASLSVCRVAWEWCLAEVWCLAGPVLWTSLDPAPVEKDCRCALLVLRAAGATASSKGLCRVVSPPPPLPSSQFQPQLVSGNGGKQGRKWNLGHQPCSLAASASLGDWKVTQAGARDYSDLWEEQAGKSPET